MILDPYNFKAVVTRVNIDRKNDLNSIPGSIDCLPDPPRMALPNTRIVAPVYTQTFSYGTPVQSQQSNNFLSGIGNPGIAASLAHAGFWHMPNVGDIGVVGFLNGYADYAVWYGSLMPSIGTPNVLPPAGPASPGDQNTAVRFQRQDAIWFHETGSFIRFRNKAIQANSVTTNNVESSRYVWDGLTLIPDITIQHGSGTNLNITQNLSGSNPPTPANPLQTQLTLTYVSNGKDPQQVLTIDPYENVTWKVLGNIILGIATNPAQLAVNADGTIVASDAFNNTFVMNNSGVTITTNGTANTLGISSDSSQIAITNNNPGGNILISAGSGGNVYLNGSSHPVTFADLLATVFNSHTHAGVTTGPGTSGPPTTPITTSQIGSSSVFSD